MKEVMFSFVLILVIAIGFLFCSGKEGEDANKPQVETIEWYNGPVIGKITGREIHVVVIDSCEYPVVSGGVRESLTHKGNCKFCEERRRRDKNNINN